MIDGIAKPRINFPTFAEASGFFSCCVTVIISHFLLHVFGVTPEILPFAREYVGITALGLPFIALTNGGTHLTEDAP